MQHEGSEGCNSSVYEDAHAHVSRLDAMPNNLSMGSHTLPVNLVEREAVTVNAEVFDAVVDQSSIEMSFVAKVNVLRLYIVANDAAGDCLYLAVLQHFFHAPSPSRVKNLRKQVRSSHLYTCNHDPLQESSTSLVKFQT